MKADKTQFWRSHRAMKSESPRESMATVRSGSAASRARSEESVRHRSMLSRLPDCCASRDEAQISKLQQLGMNCTEEAKLVAMKDYVVKLSRTISRYADTCADLPSAAANDSTTQLRISG